MSGQEKRDGMRHIVTMCAPCCDKCPELFIDDNADASRRVRITDDFNQEICMSVAQLAEVVRIAREGGFDIVLSDEASSS